MLTLKKIALGVALSSAVFAAKAQKTYTQGMATYNIDASGQSIDAKSYFSPDSCTFGYSGGPFTLKMLSTLKNDYFAVMVDVPVMSRKVAAVLTPGEIEEAADGNPDYTFTATTDTKKIGDFNCKKFIAKDGKTSTSSDLWMTNDITMPANIITKSFATLPGVPVQFSYTPVGTKVAQIVTLKSVSDAKVPAGTFGIPSDFTRISYADMKAMSARR